MYTADLVESAHHELADILIVTANHCYCSYGHYCHFSYEGGWYYSYDVITTVAVMVDATVTVMLPLMSVRSST